MHTYSVDTLRQLAAGNDFYRSLLADHARYGALTRAQIATLQEREVAPQQVPLTAVNVSHLERSFAHAKSKGVRQPTIRLARFKFMPADPERSKPENREAIFVTGVMHNDRTYFGKILRSQFYANKGLSPLVQEEIVEAMNNPYEAAVRYGHATGSCSVCNRPLSNPESVKLGIGPICRAKFGW